MILRGTFVASSTVSSCVFRVSRCHQVARHQSQPISIQDTVIAPTIQPQCSTLVAEVPDTTDVKAFRTSKVCAVQAQLWDCVQSSPGALDVQQATQYRHPNDSVNLNVPQIFSTLKAHDSYPFDAANSTLYPSALWLHSRCREPGRVLQLRVSRSALELRAQVRESCWPAQGFACTAHHAVGFRFGAAH